MFPSVCTCCPKESEATKAMSATIESHLVFRSKVHASFQHHTALLHKRGKAVLDSLTGMRHQQNFLRSCQQEKQELPMLTPTSLLAIPAKCNCWQHCLGQNRTDQIRTCRG
eukprot:2514533-Amphidinium_carterae.1